MTRKAIRTTAMIGSSLARTPEDVGGLEAVRGIVAVTGESPSTDAAKPREAAGLRDKGPPRSLRHG
jgi:hypothetical protein